MRFYIITKKHIILFFSLLSILSCFFCYIYASYDDTLYPCDDAVFCVSSLSDLKYNFSEEMQEKIEAIYSSEEKIAFITFDDGPTKVATTKVLDVLKEEDVKATFFVIGYRVKEFPNTVKRAYEEGHFIANHTYSHKNSLLYKNKNSFLNEIKQADSAISEAIGVSPYSSHLFRFPNGSKGTSYSGIKKQCIKYLKEIDYCYVDWNSLNEDSIHKYTPSQLLANLKKTTKNKGSLVILMHDTADVSRSYLALKDSIRYLKEQGYKFETFENLIKEVNSPTI